MKVKALAKGYFGSLREEGDEFEVPGGTKASWFAPVPEDEAPAAEPKPRKGKGKAVEAEAPADDGADAI